jgi:large subunit ribosomal protein L9
MDLILLEKVKNLGDLGDTVKVRPGYGRNYLLPKGKALAATPDNLKVFETRKAELIKKAEDSLSAARMRAQKLAGAVVTVRALAAEEGRLYGSVGPAEIARAASTGGFDVHKSEIDLPNGPIRVIGTYQAVARLHSEVTADITVVVEEEKG